MDDSLRRENIAGSAPLTPSAFMRELRPELYSDTVDRPVYVLDRGMLEFQLDTLTSRNEHQRFEIFCRKLCERTICPNIRPQSGPEGGGDGKTDADTYPVAREISDIRYIGYPGTGADTWAFAYSSMKNWKRKVKDDVKGIAGTGRAYSRIYFVTNQAARAADRASIEQELGKEYGIPLTILDRAWISNEVVDNERKDIAYDYLGVGQIVTDPMRLGSEDYSRQRRLNDIERSLSDPTSFKGMERQLVTEAMVAARLSRNLELPRHETEGRHARATRLAERYGTDRQRLEARYDELWTAFWWFDDAEMLNARYSNIERDTLGTDHARNIEFLVQLHQILANSVIYGLLTLENSGFQERSDRLEADLVRMTEDVHRPNHRLEARTSLTIVRLSRYIVEGRPDRLTEVWSELGGILNEAEGLAEFDADRLVRLIEVVSGPASHDLTYRAVAEQLADFVSKRSSDAEGALILLRHALRLDDNEQFETIRLLGKAAVRLAKREHAEQHVEAQQHLAITYRSVDLLWAARSSIVSAVAGLVVEGEEESTLPIGFIPAVKVWGWIVLQQRLLPEFVFTIRLLNLALNTLPLDTDSKTRLEEDIRDLDAAFGSNILNMTDDEVSSLSSLPDALKDALMPASRIALLYSLGYEDLLRDEGSIPDKELPSDVLNFMTVLKAQPVSKELYGRIKTNPTAENVVETYISGLNISVYSSGDDIGIVLAQTIVSTFEAVLATIVEEGVGPHAERFHVEIRLADVEEPSLQTELDTMRTVVSWPQSLSPFAFEQQSEFGKFLMRVVGEVFAATFVLKDFGDTFERLFELGGAHDRISIVLASLNAVRRIAGADVIRFEPDVHRHYPLRNRPVVPAFELLPTSEDANSTDSSELDRASDLVPKITRHRGIRVQSVIDIHSWNKAGWNGVLYASYGAESPPVLALVFRDFLAARLIFERWQERFGQKDIKHDINVSIIRELPDCPQPHYAVQITSRPPDREEQTDTLYQFVNRVLVMEPDDGHNLANFLEMLREFGCFFLAPAVIERGKPNIMTDLAILKRDIKVVRADDIEEGDIERVGLETAMRGVPN